MKSYTQCGKIVHIEAQIWRPVRNLKLPQKGANTVKFKALVIKQSNIFQPLENSSYLK